MREPTRDPTSGNEQPLTRKTRDRAMVLPLAGLILLASPVAGIFQLAGTIGGIPVTLAYVFLVWAGLIAVAAWQSGRLRPHVGSSNGAARPADPDG